MAKVLSMEQKVAPAPARVSAGGAEGCFAQIRVSVQRASYDTAQRAARPARRMRDTSTAGQGGGAHVSEMRQLMQPPIAESGKAGGAKGARRRRGGAAARAGHATQQAGHAAWRDGAVRAATSRKRRVAGRRGAPEASLTPRPPPFQACCLLPRCSCSLPCARRGRVRRSRGLLRTPPPPRRSRRTPHTAPALRAAPPCHAAAVLPAVRVLRALCSPFKRH